jgi:hypothetical protein
MGAGGLIYINLNMHLMKKELKTYGLTAEQLEHIETYAKTGKFKGEKINNLFIFAKEIGTAVSTIDKYFRQV